MPVGLKAPGQLLPVPGIRLAATHSGIKADATVKDLVLIEINPTASTSAVFTRNKFCAAPVVVAKEHLEENSSPRFLLINSGNANAGTGASGYRHALQNCKRIANLTSLHANHVLPFSTGVIASELPVDKIDTAIPEMLEKLDEDAWLDAAQGIMTTDTLPKAISHQVEIEGKTVTVTGIAKGSGMIRPDMATMLAFVATDAQIDKAVLSDYLQNAVEDSFNAITVDGDTSTNDACVLMASGESGVEISVGNQQFSQALQLVFQQLAHSIIRDGEGATKFVEIHVKAAMSLKDAREVAYTVAHSPLVKTALFASDPNWGRILAAVGRAQIDRLAVDRINLYLGETCLLRNGLPDESYDESKGQVEMDKEEIKITIELGQGDYQARVWTSDLSYEYVKINAEYRS